MSVIADRGSLAAGRDLQITITYRQLQDLLAHRMEDPRAQQCHWCGLKGQPGDINHCLACGHDIGAKRRAEDARRARRFKHFKAAARLRRSLCLVLALCMALGLVRLFAQPDSHVVAQITGGLIMTCVFRELLLEACIRVEVWIEHGLPRHFHRLLG